MEALKDEHFHEANQEEYDAFFVKFVADQFTPGIKERIQRMAAEEANAQDPDTSDDEDSDLPKNTTTPKVAGNFMAQLLQKTKSSTKVTRTFQSPKDIEAAIKREILQLNKCIEHELIDFRIASKTLNIMNTLEIAGNDAYEKAKKSKSIDKNRLEDKDILYAKDFFDVLKWWLVVGANTYPYLSVAAYIILGKPSHNGFQERVFSSGTFKDSKLSKRTGEDNFEMKVPELVNHDGILTNDMYSKLLNEGMKPDDEQGIQSALEEQKKKLETFFETSRLKRAPTNQDDLDEDNAVMVVMAEESDEVSVNIAEYEPNPSDNEDESNSSVGGFVWSDDDDDSVVICENNDGGGKQKTVAQKKKTTKTAHKASSKTTASKSDASASFKSKATKASKHSKS